MDSGKTKSPNRKNNEKAKMENSAKTKGHCRSKSQTYSFKGSVCDEIEKHFEQSLSLLDQKHQKSKSLPRAMKGSFPPSFFDQNLKQHQHSSTDSLQNSVDSSSLGPMRVHRTHSSSKRNRNREVENKDSHKKGRQYKQLQSLIKSEPPSAQNHLKGVASPGSTHSSSLGSPQMPQHGSNSLQAHPSRMVSSHNRNPTNAQANASINNSQHSRSRSLPIIPKRQPTKSMGGVQPLAVDIDRIPLPGNWEMCFQNGVCFFVDRVRKISQLDDPRVPILEQFKRKHLELCEYLDASQLPSHCERQVTRDQKVFFINHETKQTSWIHPLVEQQLLPEIGSHQGSFPGPDCMHTNAADMTNQGRQNDQISEITTDSSMTDDSLNIHSSFDTSLSPKVSRVPRTAASESEFRICQLMN